MRHVAIFEMLGMPEGTEDLTNAVVDAVFNRHSIRYVHVRSQDGKYYVARVTEVVDDFHGVKARHMPPDCNPEDDAAIMSVVDVVDQALKEEP